jgi:hypothetical protein
MDGRGLIGEEEEPNRAEEGKKGVGKLVAESGSGGA